MKDYLENNRLLADVNGNTLRIHHYYPYGVEIGSVRVIADASGTVLQRHHFYPYGADLDALFASGGGPGGGFIPADSLIIIGPGIGGNGTGTASPQGGGLDGGELIDGGDTPSAQTSTALPYRFSGKERLDRAGLSLYDFGARWYNPATPAWTTPDPMAEKYYDFSPYAYCAGDPVNLVDPDGQIIHLADNYKQGIENIARIIATSLGNQIISHLIDQIDVYTLNSTFLSESSSYNPRNRTINYVKSPWYKEIPYDGGALNSMIAMGHETFHAYDHSYHRFDSNNLEYRKDYLEPRAVSFGNYLRESYSLAPLRNGYGDIKGDFHQLSSNENISDFKTLGTNSEKTSYGFSYTKTTTTVESYKMFGKIRVPIKTKTKTATYFMTVSRDKDNNISFQTFNNEEAYKKATSNW